LPIILLKDLKIKIMITNNQTYIFSVYYLNDKTKLISIKASTRAKAYEKARIKAIKLNNNLDFVELN